MENVCHNSIEYSIFSVENPHLSAKLPYKIQNGCNFGLVAMKLFSFYSLVCLLQCVSISNCHIYLKEGGGLTNFKKSPFQIVTIGMGREGLKANLDIVMKYVVFFFEGVPNNLKK